MLTTILTWLAGYIGLFLGTWVLFVFAFSLKKTYDDPNADKHPVVAWLARAIVYTVGVPADVVLQVLSSVPFLDLPREVVLTSRLKRYKREQPDSWRGITATWVCRYMLNPWDPGHC